MGRPVAIGLDFAAVFAFADRMGAGSLLFLELLPEIEAFVVRGLNRNADEGESPESGEI